MHSEPPANDGWQEIVHHPAAHDNGWPTVSLPLPPPPPPLNPNAQDDCIVSLVVTTLVENMLRDY
jgi:hypothetical protein